MSITENKIKNLYPVTANPTDLGENLRKFVFGDEHTLQLKASLKTTPIEGAEKAALLETLDFIMSKDQIILVPDKLKASSDEEREYTLNQATALLCHLDDETELLVAWTEEFGSMERLGFVVRPTEESTIVLSTANPWDIYDTNPDFRWKFIN